MLIQTHRFHGYGSLNGVYRAGQTARGPLLSLRYAARDPRRPYRAAVVVSRKVSKSAVTRNRIRRRVYEVIRHHETAIKPGTDLVFTVFSEQLASLEAPRVESAVRELLQKAAA